jgi:hypothetical protein
MRGGQTFRKKQSHTGLAGTAGSEREIGVTAHLTLPSAGQWQAWSCSCHFVWIRAGSTRFRHGKAAGSAEAATATRAASQLGPLLLGRDGKGDWGSFGRIGVE